VPVADVLGQKIRLVTAESYSKRLVGDEAVMGRIELGRALTLPVKAGEVLGRLEFFQGAYGLGSVPLLAAQSVEPPTFRMILDHLNGPWAKGLALTQFLASSS
jgi:hypothetical protein